MCDEWMPAIRLPLSMEQFHTLPRNPAYKYEYFGGQAHLSPRPRHHHALLDLTVWQPPPAADVDPADDQPAIRLLRSADWEALEPVFADTFRTIQPFGSLDEATLYQAAQKCLARTRTDGDGPVINAASFVAEKDGRLHGAAVITLLPAGDPSDGDSYHWPGPPPADAVARRLGRPHLTWIFVSPWEVGQGIGTALLTAAVEALRRQGFGELLSTFLLGNESSMLWHWRTGFRLLTYPYSMRRVRDRARQRPPSAK